MRNCLFADLIGAHFGLQIVGRDLGGSDQLAILPFRNGLHAAIEEEGDVGIFFGLGDAQLGLTHLR